MRRFAKIAKRRVLVELCAAGRPSVTKLLLHMRKILKLTRVSGWGILVRFAAAARLPRKGKLSVMQLVHTALACRFLRAKTRVNLIIFQILNPRRFIAARKLVSICIIFKSKKKYGINYGRKCTRAPRALTHSHHRPCPCRKAFNNARSSLLTFII